MLDGEIAEVVDNLRVIGADIADVEVKKAAGGLPRSLRETLSGFANTHGGVIILGLDEEADFAATGLAQPAKISADLGAMCSDELEPPLRPLIQIHTFEGVQILIAEVAELESTQKPCHVRSVGQTKGSYIRIGDGDRRLSGYEVQVMLSSRGQPRDDEQAVASIGLEQLDPALVEVLVARLRLSRPFAFKDLDFIGVLRRAKVIVRDADGGEVVSLAALLALGRYPQEQFPQLMATFVHYPTAEGSRSGERFLDNVTLEGPIPVIARDALAAIHRNMKRRAVVAGAGRQDTWEYPETALREAVVNALVHRDLSSAARGTQVQIEMYPDRLVIRNPGGLFGPVTVESLGEEGISSARNATLMKILEDVPMPGETRSVCENRGSGIRAMLDALLTAGMRPPQFVDRISSFTVSFPNHTLLGEEAVAWIVSLGQHGLSDSQCVGLAYLREEGILDNRAYRAVTGVDSRVATVELRDLVRRDLVTQAGSRRWARYQLVPRFAAAAAGPARGDRRAEILAALGDDELSRPELVGLTGLSDQNTRRWLRILRDENLVEAIGGSTRSKNVRYRRARHG